MKAPTNTFELQELVRFASGGTPSKSEPSNWGGDIPWLSAKDLKRFNLQDSQDHLTAQGAKGLTLAPTGSILVLVRGMTLLKDLPLGVAMRSMTFNQDVKALLPNAEVRPHYLAYVLVSRKQELLQLVETAGHGTGRLDTDILKSFPVDLPSLFQQDIFIETLGTWDAAIEKTSALLSALERRKQGLMQQLLTGRRRLKGFKGKWKASPLRKMFEPVTRTAEGDLPVLTISAGRGFLTQQERFNRVVAGRNIAGYTALREGEFAYNKGNSKSYDCGCFYVLKGYSVAAVPNVYITFRAKEALCSDFYGFYFEADMLRQQLRRIINSGVRNDGLLNLSSRDFFNMHIPVPPLEEQRAIADVLSDASQEIAVLKQQLDELREQKRALMQKLLSGEWRLPEAPAQSKPIRKKGLQPPNNLRKQLLKR